VKESEPSAPKRKLSYKEQREFDLLEGELATLETERKALHEKLNGSLPYAEIQNITTRLTDIAGQIDAKELRWLELSELAAS
jgi:ATP-binding cassette subfamily F protein uup